MLSVSKGCDVWKLLMAKVFAEIIRCPEASGKYRIPERDRVYFLGNSESLIKMDLKVPWQKQGITGIFCLHPFFSRSSQVDWQR